MLQSMVKYNEDKKKKKNDHITGVEEMQSMAFAALEGRRSSERALTVGEGGEDGSPYALIDGQPLDHFLLAHRESKFRTNSVVGTVNRGQFEDMLGAALHDAQHKVQNEVDGRWLPIAWHIRRGDRQRRNRNANSDAEHKHSSWSVETESDSGPRPGKQSLLYENDAILIIEIVYCEMDQVSPTDVLKRRNGTEGSGIAQFARMNGSESMDGREVGLPYNLRAMPKRLRAERGRAVALLGEFAVALTTKAEEEEVAASTLNEAQITFARGRLELGDKKSHIAAILGVSHQRLSAVLKAQEPAPEDV